jgi:hypothetical protein
MEKYALISSSVVSNTDHHFLFLYSDSTTVFVRNYFSCEIIADNGFMMSKNSESTETELAANFVNNCSQTRYLH